MILVAFIPGTRSTLSMQLLRALGASLATDRYPIKLWKNKGLQDAIRDGYYRVVKKTDQYFELEQFRLETREYGKGIDTTGKPANLTAKVIAFPGIQKCKVNASDRVIFLVRPPADTCRSQSDRGIFHAQGEHRLNYYRLVWHFEEWAKAAPCPVLYFDTDELATTPVQAVAKLAEFCGLPGSPSEAAALVNPKRFRLAAPEAADAAESHYRAVRAKCR